MSESNDSRIEARECLRKANRGDDTQNRDRGEHCEAVGAIAEALEHRTFRSAKCADDKELFMSRGQDTAHENGHRISGNGRRMLQMGARSESERSARVLEAASPGLA